MTKQLERQVIELVAMDRIDRPISSMSGKIKRRKPKLAQAIELPGESYQGDRVWAEVSENDVQKAKGMKEGVAKFEDQFPKYGKILRGYIEEQRTLRETHLYFGMNEGCKVTADDYLGVMQDLGFSEAVSRKLYPELMNISRNLARKRNETERRILINQGI